MNDMKTYFKKYTFIEMKHGHDLNIFTKQGLLFSRSAFGYTNYLFDIPLLYITNNNRLLQNQFKTILKSKFNLKNNFYGSWDTIERLEKKTEFVLNRFIERFKLNEPYPYKNNNLLFGNSYNFNSDIWVDYINKIIEKEIK